MNDLTDENAINLYIHCGLCLKDLAVNRLAGETIPSPKDYSQLSIGWTTPGLQVWCNRHNCNVVHIDFEDNQHPANICRKGDEVDV